MLFDAVQHHSATTLEDVVGFRGTFVVVALRTVDLHRMRPGRGKGARIFAAD